MTVRSRLFGESFVRAVAVLGAAALALTLFPGVAQGQEDGTEFAFDPEAACPVDAPEGDFEDQNDIPAAHVNNVDCAAYFGIVLGFEDGDFRPSIPVRRDQMASFIARTLDSADVDLPAASEGKDFDDVSASNPHRDNIRRLEAAGITLGGALGLSEDEFGPALRTRRDQMTSFVVRGAEFAFDGDFESSTQQFDDVPSGNVHFENINFAGEVGIVQGFDENTFGPDRHTRRDQMTAFTVRLLNFLTTPADVEITEQSAETATVGETITVTATVFSQFRDEADDTASGDDSATLEGEEVDFSVEHAETTGVTVPAQTQTVETNEDGEAAFDFTSSQPGTVTVTADIDGPNGNFAHGDGDTDTAEKGFVLPGEAEAGDFTGEVVSSAYDEGTDEGTLVVDGERLNPQHGVFGFNFDSGDEFRLCPQNEAGDAFDGAELNCETTTAGEFDAQADLGDGVDVAYAPEEGSPSTFWLYDGGADAAATQLQEARFADPGSAGTFGDEAGDTVVLDFDGALAAGGPVDHQDVIVHVEQDGSGADIDCGEEGVSCASGPGVDALESDQFGVVVDDPANATEITDLADHLVVDIGQLRDADGDPVVVPDAGVQIQAAEAGTLPDLLTDLGL